MSNLKPFSKDRQNRAIGSLVGLSIIGVFILVNYLNRNDWIKKNYDSCENKRMIEFQGIVDTCYLDNNNKGYFTALIKTKSEIIKWTAWNIQYPQAYIQISDSVIKEKGAFRYIIYRSESQSVTIDENFSCNYWEKFRK